MGMIMCFFTSEWLEAALGPGFMNLGGEPLFCFWGWKFRRVWVFGGRRGDENEASLFSSFFPSRDEGKGSARRRI